MREIKFRGYSEKYKRWFYGCLIIDESQKSFYIIDNQTGIAVEIIKETIGQYTGLHDKNGEEIYEGDIVEITRLCILERGKVDFINGCFTIKSKETLLMLYQCGINNFKLEVVGNIYENSDLLKD